jgi:hypothetical protein
VCAHPSSVHNGPDFAPHVYVEVRHAPLNPEGPPTRELKAGLYVEITIKSDSGFEEDLDHVIDQEVVSAPVDHSVSMNGQPHGPPQQADEEPATNAHIDRHNTSMEQALEYAEMLAGRIGSWANCQLDRFRCERCGMENWQAIAASGYRLTRILSRTKFGRIRFRISKEATNCVVNDLTADAGPSPRIEVVLDIERRVVEAAEGMAEMQALAGIR